MAEFYYLYDPADNLSLVQAIHLANTDGGMSYIVPFAIKDGTVNPADAASVALQAINTAIAAGPLNNGGSSDPVSNRISATAAEGLVGAAGWSAIKAMVKASISQAPPAGWSEASLEDAATTYSVISSKGYAKLDTSVFVPSTSARYKWRDADMDGYGKLDGNRGNPYVAYGGRISDSVFLDYAGHFVQPPGLVGEMVVDASGDLNSGVMRDFRAGDRLIGAEGGNPVKGLQIAAPGKSVILANFSATTQGFGSSGTAHDELRSLDGDGHVVGVPLAITGGDVLLTGDLVIDQVTQVVDGTTSLPAPIQVSGAGSKVVVDNAAVYLGAVRGYSSLIHVDNNASLEFSQSKIYGFGASNGDAGTLIFEGLDWAGFESSNGSVAASHLITAQAGGSVLLDRTQLLRENNWNPPGDFGAIFDHPGRRANWMLNDYRIIADGDLMAAAGGAITVRDSVILGSIRTGVGAGTLQIENSVVAGTPLGKQAGQSLVQLEGGTTAISNSLIDSVDTRFLSDGSISADATTHILSSATPWSVSTTTDADYIPFASFAGSSSVTPLTAWADKDQAAAQNKVAFQFYGPQAAIKAPARKARTLPVLLSEAALPSFSASGVTTYALTARFQEAVSGFDAADLQAALGTAAVAAGWQVGAAPLSRDGGRSWNVLLISPASFSQPLSLQLPAGSASSVLVNGLVSSASNTLHLQPIDSGAGNSPVGQPAHILAIDPDFGASLSSTEANREHSIVVSTANAADGSSLTLTLNGKSYSQLTSNNRASFLIPKSDIQALLPGIASIRVTGSSGGSLLPEHRQSFSVAGPPPAALPLILSAIPAFGSVLDARERNGNQMVAISTANFATGDAVILSLNGRNYTATVAANQAEVLLPAQDLQALSDGLASLRVSGRSNGFDAPTLLIPFTVDTRVLPAPAPHLVGVEPDFGAVLNRNERGRDHALIVTSEAIADGGSLVLSLNGISQTQTVQANQALFTLPAATLDALPSGLHTVAIRDASAQAPGLDFVISVEAAAPAPAPQPHIVAITPAFGSLLDATEQGSDQRVTVSTENFNDGDGVELTLNGRSYTATVSSNRAELVIPAADLQALADGGNSLALRGQANGLAAPELITSFTVDTRVPDQVEHDPHIDQITPTFGSTLDSEEAATDQSVVVDSSGFQAGDALTLTLNGKDYSASTDGSGEATFLLPAADLQALLPSVHFLSVNGSSRDGLTAPALLRSFAVDGEHRVPHVLDIDPGFGAYPFRGWDEHQDPSCRNGSTPFQDDFTSTTQVLWGPRWGRLPPSRSRVDATSSVPCLVKRYIQPLNGYFGATLSSLEASRDQRITVSSAGLADGQPMALSLNGQSYSATASQNAAVFTVPSAALQQLASGIALLSVTAAGTGMPEAQQAFTVLGDDSGGGNGSGNTMGLRLRGTPDRDELIGADLDDRIHAGGAADRIFGYAGDDRLHGSYGADLLRGGAGDDLLVGAHGADVLSGGTGSDVFRFESIADSPTARRNRSADRILDFFSNDVIDLARFDPALTYIAAAPFSGSAGQLRFQQGQLQADVDGDRQADFLVQIRGSLSADQLIL